MKIALISLGCPKNQTDLEYLVGDLKVDGAEITGHIEDADAVIVNTCGFIEPAVNEAIENILDVSKRKKKDAKLIVTGCMVERYKEDIKKELPEIDFFTGVGTLGEVKNYLYQQPVQKNKKEFYGLNRTLFNAPYFAFLKISEGCNNRCSYCTIPSIRGSLKSRKMEDIVKEAEILVNNGVKELIIISQDTTKYGLDLYGETKIIPLLMKLTGIDSDFYIRLLYLNPDGVTDELIGFVKNNPKMIKYFEIPIQHISDKILKLMNRKSDSKIIKNIFAKIRDKLPDAIIRTTAIVGFPKETDEDFEELKSFIKHFKPDFAGFFPFYPEDGVKASKFDDRPSKLTVRRRLSEIKKIQKQNTIAMLRMAKKNLITCFADKPNKDFDFILEGRAIFQSPEIDGKAYFIEGEAEKGFGPYTCKIKRIVYPDIYCEIIKE